MSLKGKAAIVGFAEMKPKLDPGGLTLEDIMMRVSRDAIQDAGLTMKDIDGLLVQSPIGALSFMWSCTLSSMLRIEPTYSDTCDLGGASSAGMVMRAAAAIQAGLCSNVLCVTAEVGNTETYYQTLNPMNPGRASFDAAYGAMGANSAYALLARRHMQEYGTTSRQLAKIAVDERANACQNPLALFGTHPLTIEDVLSSRMICDPLHLLDIVRWCTGGAALIVTSAERAASLRKPPVFILGAGEGSADVSLESRPSLTDSPVRLSAAKAFRMAGATPKDIKLASAYDCYTITVLVTLEDAGFCTKGEGGPFVEHHNLTYKGDFPVNTHGGQLSFGQPGGAGGMSHINEAVRQIRGEAGPRQINDCDLVFVHGVGGGAISKSASLVLGRSK